MMPEARPTRVLLVDDSAVVLWGLGKLIQSEFPRMTLVGSVASADEALVYCDLLPDVTLLDVDLRGASSLGFIPAIRERSHGEVLVFTGSRDEGVRRRALALGAIGVLAKDEAGDVVLRAIAHAGRASRGAAGVDVGRNVPDGSGACSDVRRASGP